MSGEPSSDGFPPPVPDDADMRARSASLTDSDDDTAWYDELLAAGRAQPERVPWYRRIFSRGTRDRADRAVATDAGRTRSRRRGSSAVPTSGARSSHSPGPGTLSTVLGLVAVSGLAVTVAPGTADEQRARPVAGVEAAAACIDDPATSGTASPDNAGSAAPPNAAPDRAVVPDAPARPRDQLAPAPAATDGGPRDRPWVAIVERLDADEVSRQQAVDQSTTLTVLGVASEVVASEDLGEEPGSWLVVTGPFGTADQAVTSCAERDTVATCEPIQAPR